MVYVDDVIVTGDDNIEWQQLNVRLAREFEIKDFGRLKYFVVIEVTFQRRHLSFSKEVHLSLLEETGF